MLVTLTNKVDPVRKIYQADLQGVTLEGKTIQVSNLVLANDTKEAFEKLKAYAFGEIPSLDQSNCQCSVKVEFVLE